MSQVKWLIVSVGTQNEELLFSFISIQYAHQPDFFHKWLIMLDMFNFAY